ncbi:MAG: hypothetical protein PHQ60_13820 [Sideroxydans sp.]|nr:hypothetical protein [Sideroxydans sp.]
MARYKSRHSRESGNPVEQNNLAKQGQKMHVLKTLDSRFCGNDEIENLGYLK